jgi:hypothetical protein
VTRCGGGEVGGIVGGLEHSQIWSENKDVGQRDWWENKDMDLSTAGFGTKIKKYSKIWYENKNRDLKHSQVWCENKD